MYVPTDHEFETLLVQRQEWLLRVTLNRPNLFNALSELMWRELDQVFAAIAADRSLRAVLLRGAGKHFSAGGDLKERETLAAIGANANAVSARNRLAGRVLTRINGAPQVVVAAVEGNAMGGGVGLICAADLVVARSDAVFRMPEATLGIPVAQIVPFVVNKIGAAKTRRLALTAHKFSGSEAAALGMADVVSSGDEFEQTVAEVLIELSQCAPEALATAKHLIRMSQTVGVEELLDVASQMFASCYLSAEGQDGVRAFASRARPAWSLSGDG